MNTTAKTNKNELVANTVDIIKKFLRFCAPYAAAAGNFVMKQLKKVAWQALFLSFTMFYFAGYIGSIILTEICSGTQIEDLPAHGGWMIFRIFIVGIITLICRRMYYWMKESE